MDTKTMIAVVTLLSCQLHNAAPQKDVSPYQLLLNLTVEPVQQIKFDPDEALKNRVLFEKKYGRRGEKLIESFGSVSDNTTETPVS